MTINIPESVLSETTKCQHNFLCLENKKCEKHMMCEVDFAAGENILFLISRENAVYPYRVSFADRQVCDVPRITFYAAMVTCERKMRYSQWTQRWRQSGKYSRKLMR